MDVVFELGFILVVMLMWKCCLIDLDWLILMILKINFMLLFCVIIDLLGWIDCDFFRCFRSFFKDVFFDWMFFGGEVEEDDEEEGEFWLDWLFLIKLEIYDNKLVELEFFLEVGCCLDCDICFINWNWILIYFWGLVLGERVMIIFCFLIIG